MNKAGLIFYKFDGLWVLPTQGATPSGGTVHIEPVMQVHEDDAQGLSQAILDQLHGEVPVQERDPADSKRKPSRNTVMAKALNLKGDTVFYERARCFYVEKSPHELSVQEWKKAGRLAFTSPALWKRVFGPHDIDDLVWFLINHDDVAFPASGESGERRAPRNRKRIRAPN